MAVNEQDRLPCGRLVDQLWEHIDEPPDEHELGCPYCRQARARLDDVTDAAAELRARDDSDPQMQISDGVGAAIMQIVHSEVRRARMLPLEEPVGDDAAATLTISEQAVADVVREAADTVPGVRSRRCRIGSAAPGDHDHAGSVVEPEVVNPLQAAKVTVQLGIAVAHDTTITEATRLVRTSVARAVTGRTGLLVTNVDLRVEDVFDV